MRIVKSIQGLKICFGKDGGWLPPNAANLEEEAIIDLIIEEAESGFQLISTSNNPKFRGGDTWHRSLEDALAQAKSQFGVTEFHW